MKNKKVKILSIVKKSYEKLRGINPKLKIKGDKSNFDSVDVVSFFSILDNEIEKNKLKNPDFMNENFFFKLDNINLETIVNKIKKNND